MNRRARPEVAHHHLTRLVDRRIFSQLSGLLGELPFFGVPRAVFFASLFFLASFLRSSKHVLISDGRPPALRP